MNEVLTAIRERRSIRHFSADPVSEEALNDVLDAVRWSQSWANTQCWEIVVVRDQAVKAALAETLAKGNPAGKAMLAAPVVLVLCGKLGASGYYKGVVTTKFGDWFLFDLGIAAQSLCLAAHEKGLGTVVVGLFDHDRAKAVLSVPEGYELVAMIPVGRPEKGSAAPKRREISEFTHADAFGRKG